MVICLERGAHLHMAKLMQLPLAVSCFSKIRIDFTFLVPAHPCSPGKRAVKRVCVWIAYYRNKTVAVTAEFVLCPLLEDRGRITKQSSVCIPLSVGRLDQKCFQLTTKRGGRPQQLQPAAQTYTKSKHNGAHVKIQKYQKSQKLL